VHPVERIRILREGHELEYGFGLLTAYAVSRAYVGDWQRLDLRPGQIEKLEVYREGLHDIFMVEARLALELYELKRHSYDTIYSLTQKWKLAEAQIQRLRSGEVVVPK
jgi:hypothetical protein